MATAFAAKSHSLTAPLPTLQKPRKRRNHNLDTRRRIHFRALSAYYNNESHFDTLYEIVKQSNATPISLRLLEFICTTMAKEGLVVERPTDGSRVFVDAVYQEWLDSQGKGFFDPFRRNPKSRFKFSKFKKTVVTNVAQLRFFKFAINHGVVAYARKHYMDIDSAMSKATAVRRATVEAESREKQKQKHTGKRGTKRIRQTALVEDEEGAAELLAKKREVTKRRKQARPHVYMESVRLVFGKPAGKEDA